MSLIYNYSTHLTIKQTLLALIEQQRILSVFMYGYFIANYWYNWKLFIKLCASSPRMALRGIEPSQ